MIPDAGGGSIKVHGRRSLMAGIARGRRVYFEMAHTRPSLSALNKCGVLKFRKPFVFELRLGLKAGSVIAGPGMRVYDCVWARNELLGFSRTFPLDEAFGGFTRRVANLTFGTISCAAHDYIVALHALYSSLTREDWVGLEIEHRIRVEKFLKNIEHNPPGFDASAL